MKTFYSMKLSMEVKRHFPEIKAYSVIATFRLKQGIESKLNITF